MAENLKLELTHEEAQLLQNMLAATRLGKTPLDKGKERVAVTAIYDKLNAAAKEAGDPLPGPSI